MSLYILIQPIRFNGSIFSSHGMQPYKDNHITPDYRNWGSAFCWQNTRLAYWAMITAENYDMMLPLFKMYSDAKEMITNRSKHINPASRFPGFWAGTYSSVPDQDHGGVNMIDLQRMLLQTDPWSDHIYLCPAWPKEWNASFKLQAPGKTIVQGEIKNGNVVNLKVTPESRMKDIVNHLTLP